MLATISRQFRRNFALASLALGIISTFTHFMTHPPTSPPAEQTNHPQLPDLPQASGGQMAGVSNGALLVIVRGQHG